MRSVRTSVALVLAAFFAFNSNAAEKGSDSGVRCVNSTAGACVVPLFALYSRSPSDYSGYQIITTGFLRRIGENFLLFPDEGLARFAVAEQAFALIDSDGEFKQALTENDGEYVRVVGRLREPTVPIFWAEIVLDRPPQIVPVHIGDEFPPAPPPPWQQ